MNNTHAFCTALILSGLALGSPALHGDSTTLTILHVNDFHGWLLPPPAVPGKAEVGGLAHLAAEVKKARTPMTPFLAGGDLMQGSNLSNLNLGRPVMRGGVSGGHPLQSPNVTAQVDRL